MTILYATANPDKGAIALALLKVRDVWRNSFTNHHLRFVQFILFDFYSHSLILLLVLFSLSSGRIIMHNFISPSLCSNDKIKPYNF